MDIPLVRTKEQIQEQINREREEQIKLLDEIEKKKIAAQSERQQWQQIEIPRKIKQAIEQQQTYVTIVGELHKEFETELEAKGYQCVYHSSHQMYMTRPPRMKPGFTAIHFDYDVNNKTKSIIPPC